MNKQNRGNGKRGIEWTDYTWNPTGGCKHACQWQMPDGSIANCYAEDVAEGVASAVYPHGFEHHYWRPDKLGAPAKVKTPSKIFVGSMADVFGHWVPDEQIAQVLEVAKYHAPQHTYQFLTKNPKRVLNYTCHRNMWIGASTPPDFMWNKPLSEKQRYRLLHGTLSAFGELLRDTVNWLSAEPLSWNIVPILEQYGNAYLNWIVIGAASNGNRYYPPAESDVRELVEYCDDYGIPVFFKGNLKSLAWAAENWREDFPVDETIQQQRMF